MSVAVIRALPNSIMTLYFTGVNIPHNSAPPYSRAMRRAHRGRTQLAAIVFNKVVWNLKNAKLAF